MKSLGIILRKGGFHACYGAPAGIRTPNLLIRSQMLYPLSYGRSFCVNDLTIAFTSLESKVRSLPIEKAVVA